MNNILKASRFVQRLVYSFCLECFLLIVLKFLLTLRVDSQQLISHKWSLERLHICFVQELIEWITRWRWSRQILIFFLFVGDQVICRSIGLWIFTFRPNWLCSILNSTFTATISLIRVIVVRNKKRTVWSHLLKNGWWHFFFGSCFIQILLTRYFQVWSRHKRLYKILQYKLCLSLSYSLGLFMS